MDRKGKRNEKTCPKSTSQQPRKSFLDNPLLRQDQAWSLPRVELWCRDPECVVNQRLWGGHYTGQHHRLQLPCRGIRAGESHALPEVHEDSDVEKSGQRSASSQTDTESSSNSNSNSIHSSASTMTQQQQSRERSGITITHTNSNNKTENIFTPLNENPKGEVAMTLSPTNTIVSTISGNSNTNSSNPLCPNCSGVVPLNRTFDNKQDIGIKLDGPSFWDLNKFKHPLQRDHSFHSVGKCC